MWRRRRSAGFGASYWKLFGGTVVSNLGDGVSVIAFPWLASTVTRDPLAIAGLAVVTRLPWLVFSLHAGALVDRGDRRRIMVAMNTLRAGVAALVGAAVLTGVINLPLLYTAALVLGFAEVLFDNSAQTILPAMVPADQLERANGRLWGAQMIMNEFVGAPVAGLLIGLGLAMPFFTDAATAALSVGLIAAIGGSYRTPAAPGRVRTTLRTEIVEGLRWLWGHRLLRTLALLLGGMNGLSAATMATFVLFAQEVLLLDAEAYGILMAAAAVGGVAGSRLAAPLTARVGPGASLFATLLGSAASLAVIGATSNPFVVGAMFAATGFLAVVWNVITVSLRQTIIPDRLLGRVNSVYRFFGWGAMPLGTLLGGVVVSSVEVVAMRGLALRAPFLLAAAGYLLLFVVALPRLGTPHIEAARRAAGEGP